MFNATDAVVGFLYRSDGDEDRSGTVCKILARVEMMDEGFGIEPCFRVRFGDGSEIDALAQNLSPWFPT
jgi:hypothetical protein